MDRTHPVVSSKLDAFRNKQWCEIEKDKVKGLKHVRHYARLMLMEGKMNAAAGGEWRDIARDRRQWKGEGTWITNEDIPWASGRQPSIEY